MTWRQKEARLFDRLDELRRGKFPVLADARDADLRILGYLAETAALLLEVADEDALRRFTTAVRARAERRLGQADQWEEEPAVADEAARLQLNDIARRWAINPGIDLHRFLVERGQLSKQSDPRNLT